MQRRRIPVPRNIDPAICPCLGLLDELAAPFSEALFNGTTDILVLAPHRLVSRYLFPDLENIGPNEYVNVSHFSSSPSPFCPSPSDVDTILSLLADPISGVSRSIRLGDMGVFATNVETTSMRLFVPRNRHQFEIIKREDILVLSYGSRTLHCGTEMATLELLADAVFKHICEQNPQEVKSEPEETKFEDDQKASMKNVWLWGEGGIGEHRTMLSPTQLLKSAMREELDSCLRTAASGQHHTLFLTELGRVYAAGEASEGQLGLKDSQNRIVPALVDELYNVCVTQIACGSAHSVALDSNGNVYTWGRDDYGNIGHLRWGSAVPTNPLPRPPSAASASASASDPNGSPAAAAEAKAIAGKFMPRQLQSLIRTRVVQIFAGSNHTMAISDVGECFAFGQNRFGQLGVTDFYDRFQPTRIDLLWKNGYKVVGGAAGSCHTILVCTPPSSSSAITASSQPSETASNEAEPEHVSNLVPLWANYATCLPRPERLLFACGSNADLQLATDEATLRRAGITPVNDNWCVPCFVSLEDEVYAEKIEQVDCGSRHSVALTSLGRVYAWGRSDNGQAGPLPSTRVRRTAPQRIRFAPLSDFERAAPMLRQQAHPSSSGAAPSQEGYAAEKCVTLIASGAEHTLLLDSDGGVWSLGRGTYGALGHNSTESLSQPRLVEGIPRHCFHIAAAANQSFALCQLPRSIMAQTLWNAYQSQSMTDVRLVVWRDAAVCDEKSEAGGTVQVSAHRVILAARSPFLAHIMLQTNQHGFEPDGLEGLDAELSPTVTCSLLSHHITVQELEWLLEYMYTNSVRQLYTWSDAVSARMLELATLFELRGLTLLTQRSPQPEFLLEHDLLTLVGNEIASDCMFEVMGLGIPAHQIIINSRVEYFQVMLSGAMVESQSRTVVVEQEVAPDVWLTLLEYVYTNRLMSDRGHAIIQTPEHLLALFSLAHQYQIPGLMSLCENHIMKNVNEENVLDLLKWADFYSRERIKKFLIEVIVKDMKGAFNEAASFQGLSEKLIEEIEEARAWIP